MKLIIIVLAATQFAFWLTGATLDQDPSVTDRSDDLAITVTASSGPVPAEWDAETLTERILDGSARIDDVRRPDEVAFPTRDIVVATEMILMGSTIKPDWLTVRPVAIDELNAYAFTDVAEVTGWVAAVDIYPYQVLTPNLLWAEASDPTIDLPRPLEILDSGFTAARGTVNYAAVVRNPNPSRWSTWAMPVRIDVLDEEGVSVATEMEFITLLPGQTGAVVGVIRGVKGAASVDATIEEGLRYWFMYDHVTGDLDFDLVKTRRGTSGPMTSGEVRSLFTDPQEGLQVMAVYRDRDGAILGGDFTFLRVLPVEGAIAFEMDGASTIPPRRIASTELYYEQ